MDLFTWLRRLGVSQPPVPSVNPSPAVRKRFRFSGCVQGVGFRYEAMLLADQLRLTGWIRNEADGSVLAEVQGPANDLRQFLQALQSVPRFDITDLWEEELPLDRDEQGFHPRYDL